MKKFVLFCMAAIVAVATSAKPQANLVDTIDIVCYILSMTALLPMWKIFRPNILWVAKNASWMVS